MGEVAKRQPRADLRGATSPRARAEEKLRQVLTWTMRWHVTASPIVTELLSTTENNYPNKLAAKLLFRSVRAPTVVSGRVWMLTPDGLALAQRLSGEDLPYDTRPDSISHALLKHSLAVQRSVLYLLRRGAIDDYVPERLLQEADRLGEKRPDAIGLNARVQARVAIETELTGKWARELHQALAAGIQGLRAGRWTHVVTIARSQALLDRYRAAVSEPIPVWEKWYGKWQQHGEPIMVTKEELAHLAFLLVDDLLRGFESS